MTHAELAASPERLVGDVIAWELLGEGPHCATWAGWSVDRWAPVAVKLPLPGADRARAAASLRREAAHLTRLHHPAFPRVFDHAEHAPLPYLVIELVEGRPLSALLRRGPMSAGDVIRLALQLASALRYLHSEGLAHLDLKPDNILLRDGRALIIDFGAAQALGEPSPANPRGTDGYMSPEQRSGHAASAAMDIWSLGVVLREATRGWTSDRARRSIWRLRRAHRPLRRLLDTLVADDPADRPTSMTAVLAELMRMEEVPARGWTPAVARGHLPLTTCTESAVPQPAHRT